MKETSKQKKMENGLTLKREYGWEKYDKNHAKEAFLFSEGYKDFLNACKTERECAQYIKKWLDADRFLDLDSYKKQRIDQENPPKGFYRVVHQKAVLIYAIGSQDLRSGIHMIGAHLDAPRIDMRPNPLYEQEGLVYFKTHYYGGIKKYQWTTIPLAIHGVFIKENGEEVSLKIGETEDDPVFVITDLLPHLAKDQMQKKLGEGIEGEDLNILLDNMPDEDRDAKERWKTHVLKIFNQKFGIKEEDFVSAELQVVPAFKASDVGISKTMVGSYGQDDRVCAYMALRAVLDAQDLSTPCVCLLSDKEEIGSVGNTGAESTMFEDFMIDILTLYGSQDVYLDMRRCLRNSKMLSADVTAGYDPSFPNVYEKNNAAYLGKGVVMTKYTGARGKSGASDANPEMVAYMRKICNQNDILWQAAELGKIDHGGGGTIALFFANLGLSVLDCGVAILSMHSPFEISDKMDVYTTYRAYLAFYRGK
jgi:aspartyl aminopeptidase